METNELRDAYEGAVKELERIAGSPAIGGTVLEIVGGRMRVAGNGGEAFMPMPEKPKQKLKVGDGVLLLKETGQYIDHSPFNSACVLASVASVEGNEIFVEVNGAKKLVPKTIDCKPGDRVLLDAFASAIMRVLPRDKTGFSVKDTGVCWDDIGGNAEAKQALVEAIEHPQKYPALFKAYGMQPTKGVLLYGPPGCGKTMLGKAAATSIGSADGFIYCKGPEVLDPYVGVAEANVRELFNRAREYQELNNRRAIIFIDEAESLLGHRGQRQNWMSNTIVPTFLAEMDGVGDSGAIVILATNHADGLDQAIVRDGRIDRKVKIARPSQEDALEIARGYLKKAPLKGDLAALAALLVNRVWGTRFRNLGDEKALSDFSSGALLAGIVNKAKMNALRRDMKTNKASGICAADIDEAVSMSISEMSSVVLGEQA